MGFAEKTTATPRAPTLACRSAWTIPLIDGGACREGYATGISPSLDAVPDRIAENPESEILVFHKAIEAARQVYALYNAAERLEQIAPEDYNRFSPQTQALVVEWLKRSSAA